MSGRPPQSPGPNDPVPGPDDASDPTDAVDQVADRAESTIEQTQHRAEERIGEVRDAATDRVRRTEEQLKDKLQRAETTVRTQVAEVERTVGGFKNLSEPTPAGSVEEAARQAGDLRRAVDRDLDALQAKLPPSDELAERAKTYGSLAGGVLAIAGAAALAFKQRGKRKRLDREAKAHAAAIARYLPQAADEPRQEDSGGGKGKLMVLVLVAAAIGAVVMQRQSSDDEVDSELWGPA